MILLWVSCLSTNFGSQNSTKLSKYMWKLKVEKITANIKWNIMSIVHGTPKGGVCKLCLTEKFWFLKH